MTVERQGSAPATIMSLSYSFGLCVECPSALQCRVGLGVITMRRRGKCYFLPFLGTTQELDTDWDGTTTTYKLPAIQTGGVAWIELGSK